MDFIRLPLQMEALHMIHLPLLRNIIKFQMTQLVAHLTCTLITVHNQYTLNIPLI